MSSKDFSYFFARPFFLLTCFFSFFVGFLCSLEPNVPCVFTCPTHSFFVQLQFFVCCCLQHKNCCIVQVDKGGRIREGEGVEWEQPLLTLPWSLAGNAGRWWVINVESRACAGSRQLPLKLVIHADRLRQSNTKKSRATVRTTCNRSKASPTTCNLAWLFGHGLSVMAALLLPLLLLLWLLSPLLF